MGHRAKAESVLNQYCQFAIGLLFCMIAGQEAVLVVIPYQVKIGQRSRGKIPLSVVPIEISPH